MALESDVSGEFFNVCSGKETSVKELAELLLELTGRDDIEPLYVPRDAALVVRRWGDPTKVREMLGFLPQIDLRTGMKTVIDWRREMQMRSRD